MKNIKVLHFVPGLNGGGVERLLERFISTSINMDVRHLNHVFLKHDVRLGLIEKQLLNKGYRVFTIVKKRDNLFEYNRRFREILTFVRPDVIHLHQNHASLYNVMLIKLFTNIPVIVHAHQYDTKQGLKERLRNLLVAKGLVYADYKIACTKEASSWLFGGREDLILENSLDMSEFIFDGRDRDTMRTELGISGKKVIGHIGRHSYQKNQFWLIDTFKLALEHNPLLFLVVVGDGELREETIRYAELNLPNDSFKFCEVTNDISRFYSAFDVFALPSRFEGLGIVAVESQISGLPTLITETLPKDLNITENVYRLPLERKDLWVDAILSAKVQNRERFYEIAKLSKFNTLNRNVKRWIQVYEKLVDKN